MEQIPNPDWPEEIKQAYDHLKIPSLYEAMLSNEKMALEIRRLQKEIKTLNENSAKLSEQLSETMQLLLGAVAIGEELENEEYQEPHELYPQEEPSEGLEEYEVTLFEERYERVLREIRNILLDSSDAIIELAKNGQKTLGSLKNNPRKWWARAVSNEASEAADLMIDQLNSVQYRLLGQLDELGIHTIEPHSGDAFIPQKHRPLERVTGGPSGTIAYLIRLGYTQDNVVLRCADVAIYK